LRERRAPRQPHGARAEGDAGEDQREAAEYPEVQAIVQDQRAVDGSWNAAIGSSTRKPQVIDDVAGTGPGMLATRVWPKIPAAA
jgi:hypothetical protein